MSATRLVASRRLTSSWLTAGATFSAVCFVVALVAEQLGASSEVGEMTDLAAVASGLPTLDPWAWASLGVYAVLLTPVIGIGITAWEYAAVHDRRTVVLAVMVLAHRQATTGRRWGVFHQQA